jgi:hypothetical protein
MATRAGTATAEGASARAAPREAGGGRPTRGRGGGVGDPGNEGYGVGAGVGRRAVLWGGRGAAVAVNGWAWGFFPGPDRELRPGGRALLPVFTGRTVRRGVGVAGSGRPPGPARATRCRTPAPRGTFRSAGGSLTARQHRSPTGAAAADATSGPRTCGRTGARRSGETQGDTKRLKETRGDTRRHEETRGGRSADCTGAGATILPTAGPVDDFRRLSALIPTVFP